MKEKMEQREKEVDQVIADLRTTERDFSIFTESWLQDCVFDDFSMSDCLNNSLNLKNEFTEICIRKRYYC